MDVINTISAQFIGSLLISVIMAFAFMYWQWQEFQTNISALKNLVVSSRRMMNMQLLRFRYIMVIK